MPFVLRSKRCRSLLRPEACQGSELRPCVSSTPLSTEKLSLVGEQEGLLFAPNNSVAAETTRI